MAIKTFTTGEVLTAADTNTYLTNSGFQYVSSGSFTNAASFDEKAHRRGMRHHRSHSFRHNAANDAVLRGNEVCGI